MMYFSWLALKMQSRFIKQNLGQYSLFVLSLFIGIMGYTLIDLLVTNTQENLKVSYQQIQNNGYYILTGHQGHITPKQYTQLKTQLSINAYPIKEFQGQIQGNPVQIIGLDIIEMLNSDIITDFANMLQEEEQENINRIDFAIATPQLAQFVNNQDLLTIDINEQKQKIKVQSILKDTQYQNARLLLVDISSLAAWLNNNNLNKIVVTSEKLTKNQKRAIKSIGLHIQTFEQQYQLQEKLTETLYINLTAASLITLLVCFSLIYASMYFIYFKRRTIYKQLSILGVDNAFLRMTDCIEIALVFLIVCILSVIASYLIAYYVLPVFNQLINQHYYNISEHQLYLYPMIIFRMMMTVLVVLVGFSMIINLQLRHSYDLQQHGQRLVLFMVAVALSAISTVYYFPQTGLIGGFIALGALILLLVCCIPAMTKNLLKWMKAIQPISINYLAIQNLRFRASNLYVAIITLTITLTLLLGLSTMLYSFRLNVIDWLDDRLVSEIYIDNFSSNATLKQILKEHPQIREVSSYLNHKIYYNQSQIQLIVAELAESAKEGYEFKQAITNKNWTEFEQGKGVFVSESLAYHHQLSIGQSIQFPTTTDDYSVKILNIYQDFGSEQGTLLMSARLYDKLYSDYLPQTLSIKLDDEASQPAVLNWLNSNFPQNSKWLKEDIIKLSLEVFDNTFSILNAIRILLIVIAVLGILCAFLVLQFQQLKLHRILAILGVYKSDILKFYCLQSFILGIISLSLAIPFGLICSKFLLYFIHQRAFGWEITLHIPTAHILTFSITTLFILILVGLIPGLIHYSKQKYAHEKIQTF